MRAKFTFTSLLILTYFLGFGSGYDDNSTSIRISNLESKTLSSINKIDGKEDKIVILEKTVTQEDFLKVCSKLSWIKMLKIDNGNKYITDITPIKGLSKLISLEINELNASQNSPIDLLLLEKLTNLKELDFTNTKITNTPALIVLQQIEKINFTNSAVADLSFLESMPLITELILDGTNHTFVDYTPLTSLKKLKTLSIQENSQATNANVQILEKLIGLKEINISKCDKITNISFLSGAKNLKELYAENCKVLTDISGVETLLKIKTISLKNSPIEDLSALANKENLRDLDISNTKVTNLSPLQTCVAMYKLDLSSTSITSLAPLSSMENLKKIDLSNTSVSSISGIEKLESLKTINISGSKITSLDEFKTQKYTQEIIFNNTAISDIKPIYEAEKISYIYITKTIPQVQIEAIKVRFPNIRIDVEE